MTLRLTLVSVVIAAGLGACGNGEPASVVQAANRHQQRREAMVRDQIRARGDTLLNRRFVIHTERRRINQGAAAEVINRQQAMPMRQLRQLAQRRLLDETDLLEVRGVHAQEHCRLLAYSSRKVGKPSPIRRAHLNKLRATLLHDGRYAESATDFYQLPARYDDLAAVRQRAEN